MAERQLSKTTWKLMIGTAIFFDVLGLLLSLIVLDSLVTIIAWPTFWLWFRINGIRYNSRKRMATMSIGPLLDFLPFVPAWTVSVLIILFSTKMPKVVQAAMGDTGTSKQAAPSVIGKIGPATSNKTSFKKAA